MKQPNQTRDITNASEFVTFEIGQHEFGLDVLEILDVFKPVRITHIPQARPEVFGVLNLRGRIVTVIDMHYKLGLPIEKRDITKCMNIVVEHKGDHYALLVDKIGDVQTLSEKTFEESPTTMDEFWKDISKGVHKLNDSLLIILDIERTLSFTQDTEASISIT